MHIKKLQSFFDIKEDEEDQQEDDDQLNEFNQRVKELLDMTDVFDNTPLALCCVYNIESKVDDKTKCV